MKEKVEMSTATIQEAVRSSDRKKLKEIYNELLSQRNQLDIWFNKYLDMFSDQMTEVSKTDPMWKLYDSKYNLYEKIKANLKTVEYHINHV